MRGHSPGHLGLEQPPGPQAGLGTAQPRPPGLQSHRSSRGGLWDCLRPEFPAGLDHLAVSSKSSPSQPPLGSTCGGEGGRKRKEEPRGEASWPVVPPQPQNHTPVTTGACPSLGLMDGAEMLPGLRPRLAAPSHWVPGALGVPRWDAASPRGAHSHSERNTLMSHEGWGAGPTREAASLLAAGRHVLPREDPADPPRTVRPHGRKTRAAGTAGHVLALVGPHPSPGLPVERLASSEGGSGARSRS